jgi:hypothetical protein
MIGIGAKWLCDGEVSNIDAELIGGGVAGVGRLKLISVAVNSDSDCGAPRGRIGEAELFVHGPSIVDFHFCSLGCPARLETPATAEKGLLTPVAIANRTQLLQQLSVLAG